MVVPSAQVGATQARAELEVVEVDEPGIRARQLQQPLNHPVNVPVPDWAATDADDHQLVNQLPPNLLKPSRDPDTILL